MLRMLFVDKFSYSPGLENCPSIYIQDASINIQHSETSNPPTIIVAQPFDEITPPSSARSTRNSFRKHQVVYQNFGVTSIAYNRKQKHEWTLAASRVYCAVLGISKRYVFMGVLWI